MEGSGKMDISNKEKILYLSGLVNRIFKILPLYEEDNNILPQKYVERLTNDIYTANNLFEGILIELLIKTYSIYDTPDEPLSHSELKSLVFDCINLCQKIIKDLEGDKLVL
jgi:hypothetical protein